MGGRYVTRKQIASNLGLSTGWVQHQISIGLLPVAARRKGATFWYSAAEVQKAIRANFPVLANRKKFISIDELAAKLDLTRGGIFHLLKDAVLPPGKIIAGSRFFGARQIEAWMRKTNGKLPRAPGRKIPAEIRREAEQLLASGVGVREVSQRLKLGRRTTNRFDLQRRQAINAR